jgi:hypothetical protein
MPDKAFERTVDFKDNRFGVGAYRWHPVVDVTFIAPDGSPTTLPLLFDTGATTTTLRCDLYPILGLTSWDSGEPRQVATASGSGLIQAYRYYTNLEIFGRRIRCPVHLQRLPENTGFMGLLGREEIFQEFGFGFWEKTHQLYVTLNP